MKNIDVLFELGVEELPASAVKNFPAQLEQLLEIALSQKGLPYNTIRVFSTPRRLAILIDQLLAQQADKTVEKQGPQEKAAFDAKGEVTQAGLGFARSCNIEPSQLKNYLHNGRLVYTFMQKGLTAKTLLPEILQSVLTNLQAGRTMRWENETVNFVRPVRWAMLWMDNEPIPMEILGVKTDSYTYGHHFMVPQKIQLKQPKDYLQQLETEGKVLVDQKHRKEKILQEISTIAKKYKGHALIDDNLLDEVNGLVEWPIALAGKFSSDFLQVPADALISSMKTHQKCFPLLDEKQHLLPYFITISNIESKKPENVIHGNERVINARLSDAAFFFNKDKEQPLSQRLESLKHVTYQDKLGSLYDKTERVVKISELLAEAMQLNIKETSRAAWLSLCDLTTAMVQEFPELQGIMGSHYAKHDGESSAICTALAEQYLPRFSGDVLPNSVSGCALAIAQRLDTLVGQFAVGNKPTGDKDPFALRRQAQGLMRILVEKEIDLDVPAWISQSLSLMPFAVNDPDTLTQEIMNFCLERLRALYQERGGSADIFLAVAALNPVSPYDLMVRLSALEKFCTLPAAAALIAAHKRVKNILTKTPLQTEPVIDKALLQESAEQELATLLNEKMPVFAKLSQQRDYVALLTQLAELRPTIDRFFDHVMVMAEDLNLRNNRLALLTQLRQYLECVADISLLASKV